MDAYSCQSSTYIAHFGFWGCRVADNILVRNTALLLKFKSVHTRAEPKIYYLEQILCMKDFLKAHAQQQV